MNNEGLGKKSSIRDTLILGIVILLVIVVFAEVFIILRGNNAKTEPESVTRTFMIYMAGSNLESQSGLGTVDIETIHYDEMDNENVNVLLIAGGSSKWHNSYIDPNETSIFELTNDGYLKVKQQDRRNMGDGNTLTDFLSYVYDNYKTDKYDLIFWNHGSAILGSEFDELYNDDYIDLSELDKALETSPFGKDNKLEIITYNTCLNGTLEVSSILSEYSDYLVASEEVTLGHPFDGALKYINDVKTTDSAYDVSLKFIDAYNSKIQYIKDYYMSVNYEGEYIYTTYSVVDLAKTNDVIKAVNELFKDINVANNYNKIAKVRSNLYQYGSEDVTYDMVDLYNLVLGIQDISKDKANKVLKAIEDAVLYNYATNNKSRGISIYFPFKGQNVAVSFLLNLYDSFKDLKDYKSFISKFNEYKNSNVQSYSFMSNETNLQANNSTKEADFSLELTKEQLEGFAKAQYIVVENAGGGYYRFVYISPDVTLDGNTIKASIKDRQLRVIDTSDGSSSLLTLSEVENTNSYIKYEAVVILQNFEDGFVMDNATLTLIYDKNSKKISIGNAILDNKDSSLPSSAIADLSKYKSIAFFGRSRYKMLDANGNFTDNWESSGVIEWFEANIDNISFEIDSLDDGNDYYAVFRIYDTNNNYYYSKMIKIN